eukprot:scaffold15125_cov111-Isochrysis_galbana.AAC.5
MGPLPVERARRRVDDKPFDCRSQVRSGLDCVGQWMRPLLGHLDVPGDGFSVRDKVVSVRHRRVGLTGQHAGVSR